jgi:Icc-related predicted phosphoesterase
MPIKTVFKKLFELLQISSIDAVLFMGDMTDYGELSGYKSGINYLANALQLGRGRQHDSIFAGIIPGNHDIDRELAKEPNMTAKFAPLSAALTKAGFGNLPVERSSTQMIASGSAECHIVLMNSCWGCGAREYIPEEFRKSIGSAIEAALATGDPKVVKTYYDRQFDTPAFSERSITELLDMTTNLPSDRLIVVAAHHNLLPQRMTRIAPYTELVNSGAVRASLMEAKRPILYLHGHIHTNPVEVLTVPGGDALICISAPAADAGFNIIEVVFTKAGTPLVGHIIPWAFDQSGNLRQSPRLTVPLIGRRRRSADGGLSKVYAHLLKTQHCYWNDLVAAFGSVFSVDTEEYLQECVELLLADRTVTVENYEARRASWILEAKI